MKIEYAITLRCNAGCPSCSRHSQIHGAESDVTLEQNDRFIAEVKGHGGIERIWVTGGEPTVHPMYVDIMVKLYRELLATSVIERLIIVSNGYIPVSLPPGVEHTTLAPEDKMHLFRCQYVAPYDTGQKQTLCRVPFTDGCGFSAYGWYPCGGGAAICMLMGIEQYRRQTIPKDIDAFGPLDDMCRFCQVSAEKWMLVKDFGSIASRSFREGFSKFDVSKLRRY